MSKKNRVIGAVLALGLVFGLIACDADAEYTTDKSKARVDYNVFAVQDGIEAGMNITVTNKTNQTVRVEVDMADQGATGDPNARPNQHLRLASGASGVVSFVEINEVNNPTVWTRIYTDTGNTTLEYHSKTDFDFPTGALSVKSKGRVQALNGFTPESNPYAWVKVRNLTANPVVADIDVESGSGEPNKVVSLAAGEAKWVDFSEIYHWNQVDVWVKFSTPTGTTLEFHHLQDLVY